MRRALGLALVLAAVATAPAGAAVPGPTVVDFENVDPNSRDPTIGDASFDGSETDAVIAMSGGSDGGRYTFTTGTPREIEITFRTPQAVVSLFGLASGPGPAMPDLLAEAFDDTVLVDAENASPGPDKWAPLVLRTSDGSARITRVIVLTERQELLGIDEVGFSATPQPDVDITGGPAGTASTGDATFAFAGNQPGMSFVCSLDGGPEEACGSPKSYSGLGDGQHTFTVTGIDRWGSRDASPPGRTWTVDAVPDRDGDGVPDAGDNCPDAANTAQGDADGDGVGDACEVLPSGNTPIEAGRAATVRLLAGEAFVKLPAGATGSAFTSDLRAPFQASGFLPLKGVAAVPMGSTLDTRRGEVALTAAINGQPARSRRQLRREARFRAGIFAIRQARRARRAKRSKRIPPRAELASPAGAETPCQAAGPPKGVRVRSLSTTAKGVFRTVGGAATATPAKGTTTFITTDRCDGTVTEVGRGSVAVIAKRTGKRRVVRAGRAYIVRARLFAARKGRRG